MALQTAVGKAGAAVTLLGNNLVGTSAVTFNGVAATFAVVSPTQITATIPAGARTGTVSVSTPGGVLESNRRYIVRQ